MLQSKQMIYFKNALNQLLKEMVNSADPPSSGTSIAMSRLAGKELPFKR
jgi:hypothetical protein